MATVSISRSDLFPVGTTVGIYPAPAQPRGQVNAPPTAAAIATGTVDAAGNLSVTNAGILSYQSYVASAQVNGVWNYARLRSTLDLSDTGVGVGTGNTTSGSNALASVAATGGAFAIGQRITGPGIPADAFLIGGSGASWTMGDFNGQPVNATASATGVALYAYGASPAAVPSDRGVGAQAVPVAVSTGRARTMQRRNIIGTI